MSAGAAPRAYAGPRVVHGGRRAELNGDTEPNGWFVGPVDSPDRFELLGPGLGGGEGITWRARYRDTEATVPLTLAVKQLRRPPGARADWPTPGDLQRWNEQKELLQYLSLDHLATLIDMFVGMSPHLEGDVPPPLTPVDTPYVVMEWISGRTLTDELAGATATAATMDARLTHLQHITEALHAVHVRTAYGTVGTPALLRDVKPDNCVIDAARGAVLVDVGTLRLIEDGYEHPGFQHPGYTAPEVLDDPTAPREASGDLYSLGALAYFCVVGADPPPLSGRPDAERMIGRRLMAVARAARVADPHGFVDHLRLMLHPQPDERPADAVAWARRLRELSARRGRLGRKAATVAVAGAALAVGVAASAALSTGPQPVTYPRTPPPRSPAPLSPPPAALPGATGGTATTAGTTTASAAATGSSTLPPTPSGPDGTGSAPTAGQLAASQVRITAPADGSDVRPCQYLEGTAELPPGTTLVLAGRSLGPGDGPRSEAGDGPDSKAGDGPRSGAAEPAAWLSPVRGWQAPASLGRWRSARSFGSIAAFPTASGGRFQVDVLVVELDALRRMMAQARETGRDWHRNAPPEPVRTAAGVTLARVSGTCTG